jgi:probable blue pigment (indigoidine) exporter
MKRANVKASGAAAWSTAAATLLAPVSWGTSYITITELLPAGRPLLVAAGRVAPAGVVLVASGALVSRWRPRGSDWWRMGLVALLTFGLFYPLLTVAAYRLPGGVAAAGAGLQPLLVAVLSWPLAGRRPRPLELAVGATATLGVGLVVIGPDAGFDPVGLLAVLGANLSFATGVVLTKRFPAPPTPIAAAGWQMLLGGLVLVPLAAAVEGLPPALTGRHVVGFGYISLFATGLAFVLWTNGIRRLPTGAPPLLGLAVPVTGAALGWAVLGQSLSPAQLTGFVITLGAITHGATLHATDSVARRQPAEASKRPSDDHRPDGQAHDEQAAEAVQQVEPALELLAVAVDDADGDDRREPVEQVQIWSLDVLHVEQHDTEHRLHEDGQLGDAGAPPQRPAAPCGRPVRRQSPCADEAVRHHDEPAPDGVEIADHVRRRGRAQPLPGDAVATS